MNMKKTVIALALSLAALLSSCSGILEGEYVSVTKHATVDSDERIERSVISCAGAEDMRSAIEKAIISGESILRLRITDYEGDIARDLSEVCVNIPREMPEAAYTVNFITYSLNLIVSYYEADVTITYKRSAGNLKNVRAFGSRDELLEAVAEATAQHSLGFAFWSDGDVTSADISAMIEKSYYSDCAAPYIPEADVSFYPSENTRCIVDLSLNYPYSSEETAQRSAEIESAVSEVIARIGEKTGDSAISSAAQYLRESISYDVEREDMGDYSRWYNVYTAYGALVQRKAVGEGIAIAMKKVMNELGIECTVVLGMRNSAPHAWNIVKCENGSWYHVDVSTLPDGVIFFTEKELDSSYRYDAAAYPESLGPSLQPPPPAPEPAPIPEPPAPAVEEPADNPVDEPEPTEVDEPVEDNPAEEPPVENVEPDEPSEDPIDEPEEPSPEPAPAEEKTE